ncbi:Stf0 family sulfotransferase [Smaragdicoccus niigatensis]|uniref:Stf0 family sulfotransferase n=1 Tax=Smaragdicoccus niigatensis TaxID=359359 RepID=UPI00138ABA80
MQTDHAQLGIPPDPYLICTTPRSGSWLLCDGLAATGIAGTPGELLTEGSIDLRRNRWETEHSPQMTMTDYLNVVRRESITGNGVFGVKLFWADFLSLPRLDGLPESWENSKATLKRAFPTCRYIWLTRRDKARQAISLALAGQTDRWWNFIGPQPAQLARPAIARPTALTFNPVELLRLEQVLVDWDKQWCRLFAESGIDPLRIDYEDLSADYAATILRVLAWLDVTPTDAVAIQPPRMRRQSNGTNEEWLRRFHEWKATDRVAQLFSVQAL